MLVLLCYTFPRTQYVKFMKLSSMIFWGRLTLKRFCIFNANIEVLIVLNKNFILAATNGKLGNSIIFQN